MKKMKKLMALLLALAMVLSLAACGGTPTTTDDGADGDTADEGGSAPVVAEEQGEPVERIGLHQPVDLPCQMAGFRRRDAPGQVGDIEHNQFGNRGVGMPERSGHVFQPCMEKGLYGLVSFGLEHAACRVLHFFDGANAQISDAGMRQAPAGIGKGKSRSAFFVA